jgi:D-aspartate ligase
LERPEVARGTNFGDVRGIIMLLPLEAQPAPGKTAPANISVGVPKRPAVIVGADADGLGIARCLGKAGVPVILVDTDARRPAMHSRYVSPVLVKALTGPALIEGLLGLRSRIDYRPLLFLTADPQVRAISEQRERLAGAFYIRLPEQRCIRQLLHKLGFQHFAEKHGFPVPRAVGVSDKNDFVKFAELQFPAVIKPGNKELYFGDKAPRAQRVWSREEAVAACQVILREARDLIVQEWIEGRESDIYFCLQYRGENGLTVSSFVGRKLRCWPPQTGSTAACTAAPEVESELRHLTKAFFDKAQMVGMCSMEFKRDQRTGKFFMIEPTVGRTDWQEEVAAINGVNIPLDAYCYEAGIPLPVGDRHSHSVRWIYPPSYFRSVARSALRAGFLRRRRLPALRTQNPCWSSDDLVPSAIFLLEWLRKLRSPVRWREFLCQRGQVSSPAPVCGTQCSLEPAEPQPASPESAALDTRSPHGTLHI